MTLLIDDTPCSPDDPDCVETQLIDDPHNASNIGPPADEVGAAFPSRIPAFGNLA